MFSIVSLHRSSRDYEMAGDKKINSRLLLKSLRLLDSILPKSIKIKLLAINRILFAIKYLELFLINYI